MSKHPFLTGSHAYGTPSADSDIDMVVWAEDAPLKELLIGGGFQINFGKLNIIICDNEKDWSIWKKGTEALKRVAPVDREFAVKFFQSLGLSQANQDEEPYSEPVATGDESPQETVGLYHVPPDEQPTLSDWMEGWEASRESGQSGISREEAERRYYQTYGRGNAHQNGEG